MNKSGLEDFKLKISNPLESRDELIYKIIKTEREKKLLADCIRMINRCVIPTSLRKMSNRILEEAGCK